MIGQAGIFLFIPLELFLLPALHTAINLFRRTVGSLIEALDDKEFLIMADVLRIDGIARTLTKRKEINGIEQIRFPHAVLAEKTVQLG